jgi:outer membrane protein assembly factor BamB
MLGPRPLAAAFILGIASAVAVAQGPVIRPVIASPTPEFEIKLGFRDWGPITVTGTTLLSSNSTGGGGVFAVDMTTGRQKWAFRPALPGGAPQVHSPIVVEGDRVLALMDSTHPNLLAALSVATGRELWRQTIEEEAAQNAGVGLGNGLAFVQTRKGHLLALDASTGREAWRFSFGSEWGECGSQPQVKDGTVYLFGGIADEKGVQGRPGDRIWAIDASTGNEKWRVRTDSQRCADESVLVTDDSVFVSVENDATIYAVDRASGKRRWSRVVRRLVDGEERDQGVHGLTVVKPWLVGTTDRAIVAFDMATGAPAWEVPGKYRTVSPSLAVAGGVLYFQGSPVGAPASAESGTLHAMDLASRKILWSYAHPTGPNWSLGDVVPVDGALWTTTHSVLLKLR